MKIQKNDILSFILLMLLVLNAPLMNTFDWFTYFDETLTLISFIIVIILTFKNKRSYKMDKYDKSRFIAIVVYFVITSLSSIIYKYQTFNISFKGMLLGVKWFILFFSSKYIYLNKKDVREGQNGLYLAIILFGVIENYYFITNIRYLFYSGYYTNIEPAWYLTSLSAMMISLLFISWNDKKIDYICLFLMCENLLFSTRAKGYGTLGLVIILFIWIIKLKKEIKPIHLLLIGLIVLTLGWDKFYYYYIYGASRQYARPLLLANGIKILMDYFPFGTGWGTYGSYYSADPYSPIYHLYGMGNHIQLGEKTRLFLYDNYLASLFGESGLIGSLCIFLFIGISYFNFKNGFKLDKRLSAAGYLLLGYLCIAIIEETAFQNPAIMGLAIAMGVVEAKIRLLNDEKK